MIDYRCLQISKRQVSEADVCKIASAIRKELVEADVTSSPDSSKLIGELSTLDATGHAARMYPKLEAYGLTAKIPESFGDVGLSSYHPYLSFRDVITCLSANKKWTWCAPLGFKWSPSG